jgi:hypothetical protein
MEHTREASLDTNNFWNHERPSDSETECSLGLSDSNRILQILIYHSPAAG